MYSVHAYGNVWTGPDSYRNVCTGSELCTMYMYMCMYMMYLSL